MPTTAGSRVGRVADRSNRYAWRACSVRESNGSRSITCTRPGILGFRYLMDVIGTDPSQVMGSHVRIDDEDDAGPVFLCSDKSVARDRVAATDVKSMCLDILGKEVRE